MELSSKLRQLASEVQERDLKERVQSLSENAKELENELQELRKWKRLAIESNPTIEEDVKKLERFRRNYERT